MVRYPKPKAVAMLGVCAVSAALAVAGCSSAGASASSGNGGDSKIRIGYSILSDTSATTWGMIDSGILAKNHLTGTLTYTASSTAVAALLSGEIDIAQVGGADVVNAIAGGAPLTIIAIVAPIHAYQLVVPDKITSAAQLKGAKVGVSGPGSTSDIQTRSALSALGLDPSKDVSYVNTSSSSNRVAALKAGALDAAAMAEADALTLEKTGGFHTLIDLAKSGDHGIDTVLAVSNKYLSGHKQQIQDLIDAQVQTFQYERANKSWTLQDMVKYTKEKDTTAAAQAYDQEFQQVMPTNYPVPDLSYFTGDLAILKSENSKIDSFDPAKAVNATFVQTAMNNKVGG
jgi:ABC-type nitrate/sulfonate/bicarbonate transport system substrate-binding protein